VEGGGWDSGAELGYGKRLPRTHNWKAAGNSGGESGQEFRFPRIGIVELVCSALEDPVYSCTWNLLNLSIFSRNENKKV
jgi:hypothetical protein